MINKHGYYLKVIKGFFSKAEKRACIKLIGKNITEVKSIPIS
jgi:hypothetical protein